MTNNDSDEPAALHAIVTPNSKRDEKPENLDKASLQSQCFYVTKRRVFNSQNFCYMRN